MLELSCEEFCKSEDVLVSNGGSLSLDEVRKSPSLLFLFLCVSLEDKEALIIPWRIPLSGEVAVSPVCHNPSRISLANSSSQGNGVKP